MAVNNRRHRKGRRRANGDGSIWKRKDGRYAFAAYVLTTDGIYKRVQGYGRDYEDARTKLHKLLADSDRGIPVVSENWTVGDYLDYWLEHVVRVERRPKTVQGYESVIRRHLVPALGRKRLDKLTARDVRTFITNVRQQCQYCRDGTDAAREFPRCCAKTPPECCGTRLSARMVQFIHAVLRNALQTAVREEVIPRNVASLVRVSAPRYTVNRGLDLAQAKRLLKVSRDDRFHALYVLALCLGLRRGELLGLRWQDVDLVAGRLEVVHTLQRVDGRLLLVPPKTEGSVQTVPLPDLCITSLREHRERQLAERPAAGANWQDHGLVFPSRRGTPLEPTNLRRSWHPLRSAAGLDGMRFHDLRHTCVTLLLNLDVPPQVVREIVGHSDIGVTMTIYAHTSLDDKRRALGRLGDALG